MTCLCEQMAGDDIALSPTCIGSLWIFQDLAHEDLSFLTGAHTVKNKPTQ